MDQHEQDIHKYKYKCKCIITDHEKNDKKQDTEKLLYYFKNQFNDPSLSIKNVLSGRDQGWTLAPQLKSEFD